MTYLALNYPYLLFQVSIWAYLQGSIEIALMPAMRKREGSSGCQPHWLPQTYQWGSKSSVFPLYEHLGDVLCLIPGWTEKPRGALQWTVDRARGLEALIQTEPLSLLGCSKQQQGWTWSDGAVPAKHFGTCQDMKGSNETHFTIHWPRALSRQRFLPNSLRYILWPRSVIGCPTTH